MDLYIGRIVGFIIGFFFFGGPITGIIGACLGYIFVDKDKIKKAQSRAQAQRAFTDASYNLSLVDITFSMMGYVARGAGRINQDHIQFANNIMDMMQLTEDARSVARTSFSKGKSEDYDLTKTISQLHSLVGNNSSFIEYIIEIQIQVAVSDGQLDDEELRRLTRIGSMLGISELSLQRLIYIRYAEVKMKKGYTSGSSYSGSEDRYSYNHYESGSNQNSSSYSSSSSALSAAYEVLGIGESATDEEVKRAHKKLMLKYHPDRLASSGLTQEMIRLYTEKAKDIQAAFDMIKKARGM
ncbi:co-chaperone DjlA [Succinivibrio sp.]|uniref:co-chaperone DjlA n=1 Tax=Succinivibrio sp. TaxID=2053619 RepID=UPI003868BA55